MIHCFKEKEKEKEEDQVIQSHEPTTEDKLQLLLVQYFQEHGLELPRAMEEAQLYFKQLQHFDRV